LVVVVVVVVLLQCFHCCCCCWYDRRGVARPVSESVPLIISLQCAPDA
jgi:hypothetical protein